MEQRVDIAHQQHERILLRVRDLQIEDWMREEKLNSDARGVTNSMSPQ
jgi:hypothetical protein